MFLNESGKIMMQMNFSLTSKRTNAENITIHRGELIRILQQALPADSMYVNKKCVDFQLQEKRVDVIFEDGSLDRADLVIAADGIHSKFRQQLVPGSLPRYAGYTCWRGVVNNNGRLDEQNAAEFMGRARRFGIVPLKENKLYWFACMNAASKEPTYRNARSEDVARLFQQFPAPVANLIRETPDDQLLHHDILDIKPLKSFSFDRIVLLGDAAHATTPNMGQGAGQAIEDAIVLANVLAKYNKLEQALHIYDEKRVKRTAKIITMSRLIGNAAQVDNPLLVKLRNAAFSIAPTQLLHKRLHFLHDVEFDV